MKAANNKRTEEQNALDAAGIHWENSCTVLQQHCRLGCTQRLVGVQWSCVALALALLL
jgi:hypothetical protein